MDVEYQAAGSQTIDNRRLLSMSKLARKCEIKHCYACGEDNQAFGVRSRDCQIF